MRGVYFIDYFWFVMGFWMLDEGVDGLQENHYALADILEVEYLVVEACENEFLIVVDQGLDDTDFLLVGGVLEVDDQQVVILALVEIVDNLLLYHLGLLVLVELERLEVLSKLLHGGEEPAE